MEKVITANRVEKIKVISDEHRVYISRMIMDGLDSSITSILLNKREAEELHKFLGEWLK
ncbi:hypothetical protein LCGC14_1834550 [marine sediment metagenome]|uniref:Uncharacterized protein n=1 Tax=marine sediment metagenome TaxID=412755 RepID=A0A0F9GF98_9ZZZZ